MLIWQKYLHIEWNNSIDQKHTLVTPGNLLLIDVFYLACLVFLCIRASIENQRDFIF